MKKIVGLWVHILGACIPVFSQVDTTFIYNTAMSYGTLDIRIAKSSTRYYYLQEGTTFSYRESSPGVKTNTFRDMTSWDSSPYLQGNLREKNGTSDAFVMNYRLLPPVNYNPAFEEGYPIIMMVHGAGESGNCWDDDCYWSTQSWNPNTNSPPAPTTATHQLLNNDVNLLHGGSQHLAAVKLAGSKLPNDPTLAPTAFPGFVLFPQALNGWSQSAKVEDAIRLLRLIMKKYKINPNRVYIHGLSNGGGGVYQAIKRAPWLFTAALPMSAINDGGIVVNGMTPEVAKIPLWVFQGGQDKNPTPSRTFNTVKAFRDAGATIRYYLYPNLGHGTWNTAYKEPDFFSWMLAKRKTNPHIYFGNPVICNTTQTGVHIGFSKGYLAYQWEKDGAIITNEVSSEFIANTPGTYRGRFSRKSTTPSENQWEPWSDPIVVSEINPAKPVIEVTGTTQLRGPGLISNDANNTVALKATAEADLYNWYKNGTLINFPVTDIDDTLRTATFISSSNNSNGAYTLVIKNSYCPSPPSDPVYLFFNNSSPVNITLNATAVDLKGVAMSSSVYLTWNDVITNETGYEIWRRKSGTTDFQFVTRTPKDAISFNDKGLEPATTYEYKLRAINNAGRSAYVPSDNINTNYQITTSGDPVPPLPPQNLKITGNTVTSFSLSWDAAADNVGVKEYVIYINNSPIATGSKATTYTATGLPTNTTFSVYVKAKDYAGNFSPPSSQVIASTYVIGLTYRHSTGAWQSLRDTAMTSTWTHPEFTGTLPNFSLAPRTQEDYFNFAFNGYLNIQTEGDYTFRITSDDGSMFMLDGDTLIDDDGRHGNIAKESALIHLAAGPHALQVSYFEFTGGQNLVVQYKGPGIGDGNTFTTIPDAALVSGTYVAPTPPGAPTGLLASAAGMKQVNLNWQFDDTDQTDFEIYRATGVSNPYAIVGRATSINFIDTIALLPGTTYYYKIRTISSTGASAYTDAVSVVTLSDQVAPTIPGNLQLVIKNHTSAVFSWSAATDNVGVTGYEIFSSGQLVGSTDQHIYTVTGLSPSTSYTFTVKAKDASGNRSDFSAALLVTTNASATFYSLAAGPLNALTTWKQNADGSGSSPASFEDSGQFFVITNRTQTSLGGPWTVSGAASKVIVSNGVTLTVDDVLTANVDIEGNATINLSSTAIPEFQKISAASTVNFNTYALIPKKNFGNIILSGTGAKTFSDTVSVMGNLTIGNGIMLKGSPGNGSRLTINGNVIINGTVTPTSADNAVDVRFTGNVTHTISTSGDLYFFATTLGENSSLTVANAGTPVNLNFGSPNGGGLNLANGSSFIVGNNSLLLNHAAAVNGDGQTGRISINGGDIILTSSSDQHSNFYFDPANAVTDSLIVDLSGSGNALMKEPVKVSGGLRVEAGVLNSGGNITLLSNAAHTAYIAAIGDNGSIIGNVNVQEYLPMPGWIDLAAPVDNIKVADWQNYFPVTGSFAGASTGSGLTSDPSIYFSNGTALVPYPSSGGSNQAPIEKGRGYHTKLMNSFTPVTFQQTGNPFQKQISFTLAGGSGGATDGWNLVGNPFASPIAWGSAREGAWMMSGVSESIAVLENKTIDGNAVSQYNYYTPVLGSAVIPEGQGFWIQSYNATPSLAVSENAKTGSSSAVYPQPSSDVNYITISLVQGQRSDKAYVLFHEDGTDGYDNIYDMPKRSNSGIFNLSTMSQQGSQALAINTVSNSFCNKTVYLNIQDVPVGTYSLSFDGLSSLAGIGKVTLNDQFTGTASVVNSTPYSFSVTSDPASYGASRFKLTLERQSLDTTTPKISADNACASEDVNVSIANSQSGVQYFALNNSNAVISDTVQGGAASLRLAINKTLLTAGQNHVRVQAAFAGCNAQLLTSEADLFFSPAFDIVSPQDVAVCLGEQATLNVSGVPQGGHYVWYDNDGAVLTTNQTSSQISEPVWKETVYSVKGVNASGCESALKEIHLYADTLQLPVITQYSDTLVVQTTGNFQWKKDGNIIVGATLPYLKVSSSGNYTVVASKGQCSKESAGYSYVIDPGCTVDINAPQVTASVECGADQITLSVSNSQSGVMYTAINSNGELISVGVTGNGQAITLHVSSAALISGQNQIRVKADFSGCMNRILTSVATFDYTPAFTVSVKYENNTLHTDAVGTYQWKRDGQPVEGATLVSYVPEVSGQYSVVVKQGACSVESAPIDVVLTGTESGQPEEFTLMTYPVPATPERLIVQVESPRPHPVLIEIVDITGRSVFRKEYLYGEIKGSITVRPISGLFTEGIYIVVATQGREMIRKKIIVRQ